MNNKEKETKTKQIIVKVLVYGFLVFTAILITIPFYWMILTSLKPFDMIVNETQPSVFLRFSEMAFENYANAVQAAPYFTFMLNTVTVSFFATIGTVFTTILAAFAFARLNFKGRDLLFSVLISTMMIPGEIFVITNFDTMARLGLLGGDKGILSFLAMNDGIFTQSHLQANIALILPFMTSIFYIFFLRQTFKQIPDELYLAAKVDGTSDFKYLRRIMVPIATPTIITITILNAMGTWGAYIWPTLITQKTEYRLVQNGLREAYTDFAGMVAYNEQMAAALIVTFPLLVVFLLLRKYIMRGVSRSGIKG